MKCDFCNSSENYIKKYEHSYIIKGKEIKFVSERRFCANCNNLVYDPVLDNKAGELAITLYNKQYGITKEQIVNLRKNYNLSQELFSKVIGCAKKTLISYEKGTSIPNDSYLILLNCLISNPNNILIIIESNKEKFTEKEYMKIESCINKLNKDYELITLGNDNYVNEFNGYTKFSIDKLYNLILYFSSEFVLKTKLLKELFYADFLYYKNYGKSITGTTYMKYQYGPVPINYETILNKCCMDDLIDYSVDFINDYECYKIKSKKVFDKSLFSDDELEILSVVKTKFQKFGSKQIADFSHNEKAFTKTNYMDKISYDYAFDIDSI